MAGNLKAQTAVLKEYFGFLPGQTLTGFAAEVKLLSASAKLELAQGAARNLGYTQDQLDFPIK